jgi:putative DNA primase/helicase
MSRRRKAEAVDAPPPAELIEGIMDPRPVVRLDRPAHEVQDALIAELDRANVPDPVVFQRGRALVRVVDTHSGGPAVPQIEAFTPDSLRPLVGRVARCVRYVASKQCDVPMDPSRDQLAAVLSAPVWPFPVLSGIVEVPVVRPDGTIHDQPGYDPMTGLVYHPAPDLVVPPIPTHPTPAQVAAARDLWLTGLVGEFPFVADAERANALALALTPFVRALIPGPTPLHLVESPTPGSGKSLLVDVLLRPALGTRLAADSDKTDEVETAKWITAKAAASAPACWIDNVKYGLDNSTLANALTSIRWSNRLLGSNTVWEGAFGPVWAATANNPVLTGELIRRTVRIRLVSETERPDQRTGFRHPNLRAWAAAHRGDLVAAALTLIRAWVVAGRPAGTQVMGSFEFYAEVLGGIFDVVGVPGFLANRDELYEVADPEGSQWGRLVDLWAEKYGYQIVVNTDLYPLALQVDNFDLGQGGTERSQKTKFGMALAKQRDKIYGPLKIVQVGILHHAAQWKLQPIRSAATPAPAAAPAKSWEPGNLGEPSYTPPQEQIKNGHLINTCIGGVGKGSLGSQGSHADDPDAPPQTPCLTCGDLAWYWSAASTWECGVCMHAD